MSRQETKQLAKESTKLRELKYDFTNLHTLCQSLKSNYHHYSAADIRAVERLLKRLDLKIEDLRVRIKDQETRVYGLQVSLDSD